MLRAPTELPMKTDRTMATPSWSTSCFGDATQTSPMDLLALGEHLHHCSATPRPLMRLRCAAESMNGFVSARLVTTLALLSLPFVVLALLL
jgi:hypothetical protein